MRYKLKLEELEARDCPAPVVTYHGGPVIPHAHVQPVFYGAGWFDPAHLQEASWVQAAVADVVDSPYLDMLNVYGVGRGSTLPAALVNGPLSRPSVLDDALIRQQLGTFVSPPDELFVIFLAPGVASTFGPYNSQSDYLGYHYSTEGSGACYAVVAYPGALNYHLTDPTEVNQLTRVASHEISEAVTDRDVNPRQTGWYADVYPGLGRHYTSEIGDLVQQYTFIYHPQPDGSGGYLVQAEAGVDGQPFYPSDY